MLSDRERAELRERVGREVVDAIAIARGKNIQIGALAGRPRVWQATDERDEAEDALLLAIDRLREGGNG